MTTRVTAQPQITHAEIQANRLRHFLALDHHDQVIAIRKLALSGLTDRDISAATDWGVDQVRTVLGQRSQQ